MTGPFGIGRPAFFSFDYPVLSLFLGSNQWVSCVGTSCRFRKTKYEHAFSTCQIWQVVLLLLFRAKQLQGFGTQRRGRAGSNRQRLGMITKCQTHQDQIKLVTSLPSIILRNGNTKKAHLPHLFNDFIRYQLMVPFPVEIIGFYSFFRKVTHCLVESH